MDPEPDRRDLCYRLVAGALNALGLHLVFRAMQLLFGAGIQDNAATFFTSVFLLTALGLASSFCSRVAVAQIEVTATRILHRTQSGRDDDHRGTSSS